MAEFANAKFKQQTGESENEENDKVNKFVTILSFISLFYLLFVR